MSSGFGGSGLNQLKDKDDIEDDDDRVSLVGTRHRPSDPSDAPLIKEEKRYLPANQRPGGFLPSKDATKIHPPGRIHSLGGPQPGNTLYDLRNQGNTPSRKRELDRLAAPNSSEDIRPRKQQKLSVMETPSEDTDDEPIEPDEAMESDDPYGRGDKATQRQEVRRPKVPTPRSGSVSSRLLQSSSRMSKSRQTPAGPEQQKNRKNGVTNSSGRLRESKNISRSESEFLREVYAIPPTESRPTQSTHAGILQNNDSSRWNSSSSREGDIKPTKWTKKQTPIPRQQRRKSGSSTSSMKLDLLCFQHGIQSHNIEKDTQNLFIEVVRNKRLMALYGEKQKEVIIWDIDIGDISSIKTVHVDALSRAFAIRLGPRSEENKSNVSLGEANRLVIFTLKHDEDVDQCRTKFFKEFVGYTPKDEEPKYFAKLHNSLKDWEDRENAESHRLAPGEPVVTRQQNSHQMKNTLRPSAESVRRSTRNKMDKTEAMEILPPKRSRGSLIDESENLPRETGPSKTPKLELPRPRWATSLVYPPTGPKREVVDYDDLSRLNSNQFLNDNIVNFYLRYIEVQLQKRNPGLAKETYFLNTFFYERLTKKDERGKRREIDSVLKWTAKVDIFKTSYIVVPINESSHWYLAVICNLCHLERKMKDKVPDSPESKSVDLESNGTLAEAKEDDQDMTLRNISDAEVIAESSIIHDGEEQDFEIIGTRESLEHMAIGEEQPKEIENLESHSDKNAGEPNHREVIELDGSSSQRLKTKGKGKLKVKGKPTQNKKNYIAPDAPAIIILDSMGPGTSTHASTIKNLREYLAAEALNKRNLEITKDDIKATYAKAPNQNNWYDCGLFLLHYVERFLDRPKEFAAMFLAKEVNMRDQELWRKEEIKGMREKLFHLFVKLHEEQEAVEMEQRGLKKRGGVNANEAKGQKLGNRKVSPEDVMTADAEGSAKDRNMRKVWIGSEPAAASEGRHFEEFTHQLGDLITSSGGSSGGSGWRGEEEKDAPTKLMTQVIGEFAINLEEEVVEVVSNSMPQVTLSVRNNQ